MGARIRSADEGLTSGRERRGRDVSYGSGLFALLEIELKMLHPKGICKL